MNALLSGQSTARVLSALWETVGILGTGNEEKRNRYAIPSFLNVLVSRFHSECNA